MVPWVGVPVNTFLVEVFVITEGVMLSLLLRSINNWILDLVSFSEFCFVLTARGDFVFFAARNFFASSLCDKAHTESDRAA